MSIETEFYIKIACTFIVSIIVFAFMQKVQKRKEEEADRKFELTLKSRGMSLNIEEKDEK